MVSTGDRSAKIRTYNYPQGRVTDHRINWSMYNLPVFMDGDIQECINQLQIAENAERLKAGTKGSRRVVTPFCPSRQSSNPAKSGLFLPI